MRRNHPRKKSKRKGAKSNAYILDYIILPHHPEISHIVCKPSKTVYQNLAACEEAVFTPVIHTTDDPAMRLLTGNL